MTTIPVERKKIESWLTGLQCGVISQRHVFEDLRALLSEQPQADHSAQDLNMVEQPQAGAGHDFIKTGDKDSCPAIEDRNGEVVLNYCRACKQAESELEKVCPAQPATRHDQGDEVRKAVQYLPYQMLFNAIADSVRITGDGAAVSISVKGFKAAIDAALTQSPKGEEE